MKIATKYNYKKDELKNKIILVTGANRGLGKAIALDLARAGATVILLGRDMASLETIYDEIMAENLPEPLIHGLDLEGATPDDYFALQQGIEQNFGRLDGLIHNAAILGSLMPVEQYDIKLWYQTMQININAPFMLTQFCIPLLVKSDDARVLFLSSGVGREGYAYWGAYGVSKFALEGFMQILAEELENTSVKVNSITPAVVRTKMRQTAFPAEDATKHPLPEEVSSSFVYLMSEKSKKLHKCALSL
ncbi:Short-chain dehydrogenase/reductase SDR [hydrothermal vent metagenome]|uniref:Short-chain dehydrogenase/reductase SDR n=1 Tax=hydrothermal vent metagenome TaxID=652676 RepID=A0A1W1CET4_9ZZZZ